MRLTGSEAIIDSSLYNIPDMQFSKETHPGKVYDSSKIEWDKHYHPASIGDIDFETLDAQCRKIYDYHTHTYVDGPGIEVIKHSK